jgi:hypothetical protein
VDVRGLAGQLQKITDAVEERGAVEATNAMGRSFRRYVLKELNHSESAPGQPPARRSGALSDSVTVTEATGGGTSATVRCGPHVVYDEIQEHGGTIHAHPGPARGIAYHGHAVRGIREHDPQWRHSLSWVDGTGRHFAMHVTLPARPYMAPAHEWAESGGIQPAGKAAIDKIIDEASG